MSQAGAPLAREAVARSLEQVFARPELRPESESWLDRQLERLLELLPAGELPEAAAWGLLWLLAAMLGLALGFLIVQLRRHGLPARRRAAPLTAAADTDEAGVRADRLAELRRRAREARDAGDLVLALRLGFFALVLGLGRRGSLEYRDAWTPRELLARGQPAPDVAAELAPLVARIDAKTFGRAGVERADVERIEALCARWLDGGETRP